MSREDIVCWIAKDSHGELFSFPGGPHLYLWPFHEGEEEISSLEWIAHDLIVVVRVPIEVEGLEEEVHCSSGTVERWGHCTFQCAINGLWLRLGLCWLLRGYASTSRSSTSRGTSSASRSSSTWGSASTCRGSSSASCWWLRRLLKCLLRLLHLYCSTSSSSGYSSSCHRTCSCE